MRDGQHGGRSDVQQSGTHAKTFAVQEASVLLLRYTWLGAGFHAALSARILVPTLGVLCDAVAARTAAHALPARDLPVGARAPSLPDLIATAQHNIRLCETYTVDKCDHTPASAATPLVAVYCPASTRLFWLMGMFVSGILSLLLSLTWTALSPADIEGPSLPISMSRDSLSSSI